MNLSENQNLLIRNDQEQPGHISIEMMNHGRILTQINIGLPIASMSVQQIESELDLHSLPKAITVSFLRECRRILQPGGRLRLVTTDLAALAQTYISSTEPVTEEVLTGRRRWLSPSQALLQQIGNLDTNSSMDALDLEFIASLVGLHVEKIESRDGILIANLAKSTVEEHKNDCPLVSVLVAAYRPDFLDEAISSARRQTWENIEIIIGDDSPSGEVGDIVKRHIAEDPRVRYIRHEQRVRGRGNYVHLFEACKGDYIKYLNDDDLLAPLCVERMARCLLAVPEATLITSHRQLIDEKGATLPDIAPTRRPVRYDSIIDGASAISVMMKTQMNWIGEPTTTMFRRSDIRDDEPDVLSFAGLQAPANADTTLWTHLLSQGDLVYLIESLSSFRQHNAQAQRQTEFLERARKAWELLTQDSTAMGMGGYQAAQLSCRILRNSPWWDASTTSNIKQANQHMNNGELLDALNFLGLAIEAEPNDPVIRLYRAQLETAAGDLGGALLDLVTATAVAPHFAPAQRELAIFYHQRGNITGAREALEQMRIHNPDLQLA